MDNPLIRIDSNAIQTEVYYNGEKIEYGKQILFFAIPFNAYCEVEVNKCENGKFVFNKNHDQIETENIVLVETDEIDEFLKEYFSKKLSEEELNKLISMWQKYHLEEPK